MNLHDRLRTELRERSSQIDVTSAGADTVMDLARRRLRRTRIMGAAAATILIVGVTSVALAVRETDQSVTTDENVAIVGASDEADASDASAVSASGEPDAADETAAAASNADDQGIANTEADPQSGAEPATEDGDDGRDGDDQAVDDGQSGDPTEADSGQDDSPADAEPEPPAVGAGGPATATVIAHQGGFVAIVGSNQLSASTNGTSWRGVTSPAPNDVVSNLASHGGVLYATGTASVSDGSVSWVSRSSDLNRWERIGLFEATNGGSPLTRVTTSITGVTAGASGVLVTGQTRIDVRVEDILSDDVLASGSWSLGDSTGDRTKILIYDDATGDIIEEIELADLGVPAATLDRLATDDPEPFVGIGSATVTPTETNLPAGTVLRSPTAVGGEYLARGFSRDFSGQIVWSSPDGASWTPVPVSVVSGDSPIVAVGDTVAVFSTHGPLFTVQVRRGGEWSEVRLHNSFGSANSTYRFVDAAASGRGIAAVAEVTDTTGRSQYHLLRSSDGVAWTITTLDDALRSAAQITTVSGIALAGSDVVIGYSAGGTSTTGIASLR